MTIRAILTDIEGTTTSISFVYDTLFPYFKDHIDELCELKSNNPNVSECFTAIKQELNPNSPHSVQDSMVITQLKDWVEADVKHTHLKTLQGFIWKSAYQSRAITGHLYPDVAPVLNNWKKKGVSLNVYSSGSESAQKLLFAYSDSGDLTPLFDHYFDTRVGHKREVDSYLEIANRLKLKPEEILFLSDIEQELDAASQAGMNTIQLVRPGTPASTKHKTVSNFQEIEPTID